MASRGAPLRDLLLDPAYWHPRLEKLGSVPRRLLVFPRPDLSHPGVEVVELRLRAHDGARLQCILARPSFGKATEVLSLRIAPTLCRTELDWHALEGGHSDAVFAFPPDRRLEDRVLDVLRVAMAAGSFQAVDWTRIDLMPRTETPPDELVIANMLRARGLVQGSP